MDEVQLIARLKAGDPVAQKEAWDHFLPEVYRYICSFSRVRYTSSSANAPIVGHPLLDGVPGQDNSDAVDILEDTFADFFKDIHKFKSNSRLSTWLYSIARHNAIDFYNEEAKNHPRPIPQRLGRIGTTPADEENTLHIEDSIEPTLPEEEHFEVPRKGTAAQESERIKKRHKEALVAGVVASWTQKENEPLRLELNDALSHIKESYREVIELRAVQGKSVEETAEILGMTEAAVKMAYKRGLSRLHDVMFPSIAAPKTEGRLHD